MSYHIHKNPLPPPGIKPPAPCPKMIEKMRQLEEEEKKAKVAQEIFMHEAMDFQFVEATEAEIYAMFDQEPPTPQPEPVDDGLLHINALTQVDEDEYIPIPDSITIDEDGFIQMAENISINEDGYLIEN